MTCAHKFVHRVFFWLFSNLSFFVDDKAFACIAKAEIDQFFAFQQVDNIAAVFSLNLLIFQFLLSAAKTKDGYGQQGEHYITLLCQLCQRLPSFHAL